MPTYFRTPEMNAGGPFRCYNCNKVLAQKISGNQYKLEMRCPRCKAKIIVEMNEPIPVQSSSNQEKAEVSA